MCAPRREGRSRGGFFVFRWLGPGDRQRHAAEPGPPRRGRGGHRRYSTGTVQVQYSTDTVQYMHSTVQDMLQNQDRLAVGGVAIAGTVQAQYSTGHAAEPGPPRPRRGGHRRYSTCTVQYRHGTVQCTGQNQDRLAVGGWPSQVQYRHSTVQAQYSTGVQVHAAEPGPPRRGRGDHRRYSTGTVPYRHTAVMANGV
eukprot:435723-Prorocentrum_minimum.AAC.1